MSSFDDKMPAWTSRLHLSHGMSQWLGDSRESVRVAKGMPVGRDKGKYVDNNVQMCKDDDVVAHGHTMRILGFKYLCVKGTGGRIRVPMNKRLLDRPLTQWKMADVRRVRRTFRKKKGSWESLVALESVTDRMEYCKENGVVPFFELKTPAYGLPNGRARIQRMVNYAKKINLPAYFMALDTMVNLPGKAKNVHEAGGQFAVLAHKRMPSNFRNWSKYVDQVYGQNWLGK